MDKHDISFVFIIIAIIVGFIFYINNPTVIEYKNPKIDKPVACSDDTKLCPDGSFVSRVAPDCDFKLCK